MGGRGNSGIILSQIVRGLCDALATAPDASESRSRPRCGRVGRRLPRGAPAGRGHDPDRVREMAAAAEAAAGTGELRAAVLAAGEDAVARTPELLAVLRDAGVVDAGGAGLLEIVRGAFAGLSGEELGAGPPRRCAPSRPTTTPSPRRTATAPATSSPAPPSSRPSSRPR